MGRKPLNKNTPPQQETTVEVVPQVIEELQEIVVEQETTVEVVSDNKVVIIGTAQSKCLKTGKEYTVKQWEADYLIKGNHAIKK